MIRPHAADIGDVDRSKRTFSILQQFSELRVELFGKDSPHACDEECAKALGFDHIAKLHQIHGNITHVIDRPVGFETQGDGLITKTPNLALSVRFADCQAFAIYAPKQKIIGVLHAGWRGMAAKAITKFYEALDRSFGVNPAETFVGIAPSLCKHCADFTDPKNELPEHLHPFIEGKNVDLQAAADAELASLGTPKDHIERHPECTRCDKGFWSWRRDKTADARNYLIMGLLH